MGASHHAYIRGISIHTEVQKLQIEAPHIILGRCLIYLTGDTDPQINQDFVLDEADEILSHGFLLIHSLHTCFLNNSDCDLDLLQKFSKGNPEHL